MKRILTPLLVTAVSLGGGWLVAGLFSEMGERNPAANEPGQHPGSLLPSADRFSLPTNFDNSAAALVDLVSSFPDLAASDAGRRAAIAGLRELPSDALRLASLKLFGNELRQLEPAAVLDLVGDLSDLEQVAFLDPLIESWLDRYPAESIAQALGEAEIINGKPWQMALSKLAGENPAQAIALLERFFAGDPHGSGTRYGFDDSAWGQNNMASGLEFVRASIFFDWAKSDPVAAANGIEEFNFGDEGSVFRHVIAFQWFRSDPAAAFAWIDRSAGVDDYDAVSELIQSAARESPERVFDLFEQFPEILDRPRVPEAFAKAWRSGGKDANAVIEWLEQTVSSPDRVHRTIVGMIRSREDLEANLELFERLPEGSTHRLDAISGIAGNWASEEPDSVMAWVNTLDSPAEKLRAMKKIFSYRSSERVQLLMEHRRDLIDSGIFETDGGEEILEVLTRFHPNLAREWFEEFPDDLRNHAAVGIAKALVDDSPTEAAEFVESLDDSPGRSEAVQRVVTHWALVDPAASAEWVSGLPDGESRDFAIGNLINNWSRHDPAAAEAWLASQSPSPARDRAARAFVEVTAWLDPEKAFQWAATISGDKSGNEALRQALRPWARRDPAAALASIETLSDSPEAKEGLRTFVAEEEGR